MKTKIKIAVVLTLGVYLGVKAQDYVPKTGGTFSGDVRVNTVMSVNSSNDGSSAYKFGSDYAQIYYDAQSTGESNRGVYFQEKLSTQRGFHFLNMNGQNLLRIKGDGNIGMGTINPASRLEVNGDFSLARTHKIKFLEAVGGDDRAYIRSTYGQNGEDYNSLIFAVASGTESMIIKSNGNVGIGTNNPGVWKLAVNGKIRAKEIKVETEWSDFVFYEDYKLPTLQEVEEHIKEKGHLKDIPSAKEVVENGIYLGEMDSKLLQKIEELTLYTIQQQKEIENLKKENDEVRLLNKKLLEIQARLDKLENE